MKVIVFEFAETEAVTSCDTILAEVDPHASDCINCHGDEIVPESTSESTMGIHCDDDDDDDDDDGDEQLDALQMRVFVVKCAHVRSSAMEKLD